MTISKIIYFSITGGWLALALPAAFAQTSGTLATDTSGNYSVAPWTITSGSGTYPTGGGTAEFDAATGLTAIVPSTVTTITLDVLPTLSGVTFNSPFSYTLAATGSNTLNLSSSGATFTATDTPASTPTLFAFGDLISAPITGGGTTGLTITGGGIVDLTGVNSYTGGTTITGGSTLTLSTASDGALGATGSANSVTMNNGNLLVYDNTATTAMTTARNFTLNAGGGNFELFNGLTISGVVGGAGALSFTQEGTDGTLTLTGANTYTGATVANGVLDLTGSGTILNSSSYTFGSEVVLDSYSSTSISNRLNATAPVTLNGTVVFLENKGTAVAQVVGATTLNSGNTFVSIAQGSTKGETLTFASLARVNNSTLDVTGNSLGNAPGTSVTNVYSTSAPTLLGGGGAANSTNISIVPWATGNTAYGTYAGNSFVTYGTNGFRPLSTSTEYASLSSVVGTSSTQNSIVTATTAVSSATTVNSVLVQKTGTPLTGTGGLTITSGALMYSPTSANTSGTVSANLNFGSAEGLVTNTTTGGLTLSGAIGGSGGVTLNSIDSGIITLSGANTYTGTTTLVAGTTEFSGTVANDGVTAGPFGESTTAIVLNPGANGVTLYAAANSSVINRDLMITGAGFADLGVTTATYGLTVNGNINLLSAQSTLFLDGGTSSSAIEQLNGVISGSGSITDNSSKTVFTLLSGNNTYTGGTNIQTGTYMAASNTAFGSGTISFSGAGTISVGASSTYTFGNNLFLGAGAGPIFGGAGIQTYTGGVNLNGSQTLTVSGGGTTFAGTVSNGALTKLGAGAMTLSGANTYTGGTVISAGSVLATNTTGSATGAGAVFVNASGTLLGGTGTVAGPVSVVSGGTIEGGVGTATGALTLNNNLTLATGSIIELTLAANGNNSSLTRGGGTWTFSSGQKFTFLGNATTGTTYDGLITGLASNPGGESSWTITNSGFAGTFTYDAGDIDLMLTSVPEPGTWLAGVLTVLVGAAAWRQMRQRHWETASPVSGL